MRPILTLLALSALAVPLLPVPGAACDAPLCIVDPATLRLGRTITFDDQRGGAGPGVQVEGLLVLPGASFGVYFAGQGLTDDQGFTTVWGPALPPLTLLAGPAGQPLTLLRIGTAVLLSGTGPRGFPQTAATGEGAVAILFDDDQAILRLDLRGGEGGVAILQALARDGTEIGRIAVSPLTEAPVGLLRGGPVADIAGLVITNRDPEGIALDAVGFDGGEQTSLRRP